MPQIIFGASFLLENPVPIVLGGILFSALALFGLLKTGLIRFLYIAIGIAAVTCLLVVVERKIVTPTEEIAQALQEIAADLQSNQPDAILAHVSSSVPELRKRAERALKPVEIDRVVVKNNLTVDFGSNPDGNQAKASFNAVVVGSMKSGAVRNQTSPFFFIVDFVKEDGKWRVVDYTRKSPTQGITIPR